MDGKEYSSMQLQFNGVVHHWTMLMVIHYVVHRQLVEAVRIWYYVIAIRAIINRFIPKCWIDGKKKRKNEEEEEEINELHQQMHLLWFHAYNLYLQFMISSVLFLETIWSLFVYSLVHVSNVTMRTKLIQPNSSHLFDFGRFVFYITTTDIYRFRTYEYYMLNAKIVKMLWIDRKLHEILQFHSKFLGFHPRLLECTVFLYQNCHV